MQVRVLNLGSGSSGNALLIASETTNLLVDCGVGPRTIAAGLKSFGLSWPQLQAVLVSHEHIDHIRALSTACRHNTPIICTDGTGRAAGLAAGLSTTIANDSPVSINGVRLELITTSHDAAEPCGFFIQIADANICVITDTGEAYEHFIDPIRRSDLVIVEANHDEQMLWNGPYPMHLKRRVASRTGHLSNGAAGELLREALRSSATRPEIWLGHLSESNNKPNVAVDTVRASLGVMGKQLRITPMTRRGDQRWNSDASSSERQLSLL